MEKQKTNQTPEIQAKGGQAPVATESNKPAEVNPTPTPEATANANPAPAPVVPKKGSVAEMRERLHKAGYPNWVWRDPQDVNTYEYQQDYSSSDVNRKRFDYKSKSLEQFRTTHGFLTVYFDKATRLYHIKNTLVVEWGKTPEAKAFLKEFAEMNSQEPALVKINKSGTSSERRQAVTIAKWLAGKHQLAFAESKDIDLQGVTTADLTSKERRQEVYKRMEIASPEAGKPADEAEQKVANK
ncbi:MAG TPA: hypothetical protein VFF14_01420 [Candidatus Deferrimicrobium sp.]|nr:hypothetical protein [Candidatus Deferrimicrobium sp.]